MNVLYLHGFRSSPASSKALQLKTHFAATPHRFVCPQLPDSPAKAISLGDAIIRNASGSPKDDWALIGSSLGGFYATVLAERFHCRAVLINPSTNPARDLAAQVGLVTSRFHSETPFSWTSQDIDELRALALPRGISVPSRYLLIAATGDELLDWREMSAFYAGATHCIIQGGDHGLTAFAPYLRQVEQFCTAGIGRAESSPR
jgi:uncharacterized protein